MTRRRFDEQLDPSTDGPSPDVSVTPAPEFLDDQQASHSAKTPLTAASILALQRSSGNASVARLIRATPKRLARKARVGLSGWGSPLFGDDDSDVTFTPEGTFQTGEFTSQMADLDRADADFLTKYALQLMGAKAGQYASSAMNEQGGYSGTLQIKAGAKGTITITVAAHFFFDEKSNDEYDSKFECSWDVEADLKGKLQIGKASQSITPIGSDEAPFQLSALNPEEDDVAGTVQITPQFNSYQVTDVPNVSIGGNVDFGEEGKGRRGGVSGGITLGNEQAFPAAPLARTFALHLVVTDIPEPKGTVTFGPITARTHKTHEVLFEKPKQDRVSGKQEEDLYKWFTSLSPETRALLREGDEKVKLDGYASTTDKAANNRELARRRVDSVMKILRDFGPKQFDDAAFGEYEEGVGEPKGEVEAQTGRKVVIDILEAPVTIFEGEEAPPGP